MKLLMSRIFEHKHIYLEKRQIYKRLVSFGSSELEAEQYMLTLDDRSLCLNIDQYYQEHFTKKKLCKLPTSEIIRFIVRNKFLNSEYGNFHKVEYRYISGMIINELLKLGVSSEIIISCQDYLDKNMDEMVVDDRYILSKQRTNKKMKYYYDAADYKVRNMYVVSDNNQIFFCTRKIINKQGKIIFLGQKYYNSFLFAYYDIQTGKKVCDNSDNYFSIVSLDDTLNDAFPNNDIKGETNKIKKLI